MAREALTRLANTEQDAHEGPDEPRDPDTIADDIAAGAREVGVDVAIRRTVGSGSPAVPGRVARALTLAATQAIANALQHADGIGLAVTVTSGDGAIAIEVRDAGEGFELEAVPDDRLGIRASIFARVAAVGGTAHIDSGHHGTVVHLEWREGAA
jgi:signal transduction histidine kinase